MKRLVGYITASLPNNNFTIDLALSMKESGVDILELGLPFSDPVADGTIIEKANLKAIQSGYTFNDLLFISSAITPVVETLWMGYMNSFYVQGLEYFCQKANENGIGGFIIPDAPYEEVQKYQSMLDQLGQSVVQFIAPTTPAERIKMMVQQAHKFIYLVAYTGITGNAKHEDLTQVIQKIRSYTNTPVYIGFGVNEKTAVEKSKHVDGVIVGSAFVEYLLDDSLTHNQKITKISQLAYRIKQLINS